MTVTLLIGSQPSAQQREHLLDLIRVPSLGGELIPIEQGQVPPYRRLVPGAAVVSPHTKPPSSPFTLSIEGLEFDRMSYGTGESYVYEVRLKNTGQSPVSFPLSVDSSLFEMTVPDSHVVELGVRDANEASFGGIGRVTLYGAPSVPASLEQMMPGETMLIRVKNEWFMYEGVKRMQVVLRPTYRGLAYATIVSRTTIELHSHGKSR